MIPQGGSSSTGSPSCSSASSSSSAVNSTSVIGQADPLHVNTQPPQQNRWVELRHDVRSIRNRLSSLDKRVPSVFTFRTIQCEQSGRSKVRLYFLSAARSGGETTLMFADLPDGVSDVPPNDQMIRRFPLIEPSFKASKSDFSSGANRSSSSSFSTSVSASSDGVAPNVPSRDEQLQRERKRVVTWGISVYEFHSDSSTFIFNACGSLFTLKDSGLTLEPQHPREVKLYDRKDRLNPQVCPWNPDVIAYVSNGEIYVQHVAWTEAIRLTYTHNRDESSWGSKSIANDPRQAGMPAYVIQEEFRRYVGFWWQPTCPEDGEYRILYEEVDESDVEILRFVSPESEDKVIQEFRYPRTGTANAKSTLKLLEFKLYTRQELNIRVRTLKPDLDVLFPWMEYLVRVGWTPDGENVWIQCLDRRQCHLQLIMIPLTGFLYESQKMFMKFPDTSFSHATTLIDETNNDWINVHDILYFLPSTSNDDSFRFVWADELNEFRRLLLVTVARDEEAALVAANYVSNTGEGTSDSFTNGERHYKLKVISKVPLTNGDWEVLNNKISVDEKRQIVYFTGMRQGPLEKHLYAVSLSNSPGDIRQITANGYSHSVTLNKECDRFVSVYSSMSTLTTCEVFAMEYPENEFSVHKLVVTSLGFLLKQTDPENIYRSPKLFVYEPPDRPDPLYCMIYTPPTMKANVKYPTVLYVYGGPEMQMVNNSFKGMRYMRLHMLAAQGYVVVVVDSRGSCHRGIKFESYIKGRMGTVEIADQVEVLQWLADQTGFMDMSRVAIHGWSYGGYLSLMGLAQRPDIFKVAIAGAPVTSWLLYDTAYTERYMDLPSLNSHGYATGNVLSYVQNFPNEANRLVIIHGLIDENVHFQHTSQLISALVKAGKPYHLQIYPSERHSLRHLDSSEHYEVSLLSFLEQHL